MKQREVAERFIKGLDEEQYEDVLTCLSPDCEYKIKDDIHIGPQAVVNSYKGNGDWAMKNIEKISYGSALINVKEKQATVEFFDHLEHGGQKLTHRCHQHLNFNESGLICKIRHEDLPGEQESLKEFFVTVGLKK